MKPNKEAVKSEDEKKERNRSSYSELPNDEESTPTKTNKKEAKNGKEIKESWVFRKNKSTKVVKNDPTRFIGEGVNFKAKIIGIEDVFDARGNRMCQDALQKLKAAVKTAGGHKQRILLNISLLGIRIKDEKSGEVLHQHPVHKISFISQDVSDNRAFGYVYGCPQTGHQFFGIKTEKTATQVVCTLRDLFHTALELKKKEIEKAMEQQQDAEVEEEEETNHKSVNGTKETNGSSVHLEEVPVDNSKADGDHIYPDLNSANGIEQQQQMHQSHSTPTSENASNFGCTVDNLLDLQFEMDTLQQGITQMEYSIASAVSVGFGVSFSEDDSVDRNSISSGSSYPMTPRKLNRMSSLYQETLSVSSRSSSTSDYTTYPQESGNSENFGAFKNEALTISPPPTTPRSSETSAEKIEDRYAVFYEIDSMQSIFDNPTFVHSNSAEGIPAENFRALENGSHSVVVVDDVHQAVDDEHAIMESTAMEQPISDEELSSKPEIFAALDPLGNQPYVEREHFFQELKNPPKKVLKELAGNGCESSDSFTELNTVMENYSNGEVDSFPVENTRNPFVTTYPLPPKLPPKRSFGVISPPSLPYEEKPENLESIEEDNIVTFKNPFNPFLSDTDEFSDIPLPTSPPPPPPPPRLPCKDIDSVPSMSPPPRPPSRSSVVPTPPRPRRKVPLCSTANPGWFSFDQEAITASQFQANWDNQLPSSPPLPIPSRKLPPSHKFDSSVQKSSSASNSPALMRRYSNVSSSSAAFKEFSDSVRISNGTSSPNKKVLTRHSSIIQETWGHKANPDIPGTKNSFDRSAVAVSNDCTEVNRIMSRSPPLPPKTTGIARPRPSPSRKMLSAPYAKAAVSSASSAESKNETISSGSLRYSGVDDGNGVRSGSEALYRSSTSSQSDTTCSSGYNGEVSGEIMSTESSMEKVSPTSPDSIFHRKDDPFADEFFLTLPKKSTTNSNSSTKAIKDDDRCQNHFQSDFDSSKVPTYFEVDVFENKTT